MRGVEIGIVLLVLLVWVAAIALFFNRWGKIRMLLPYQPDYKEQLKVPGSAACAAAVAAGNTCSHHSGDQLCSQVKNTTPSDTNTDTRSRNRTRSSLPQLFFKPPPLVRNYTTETDVAKVYLTRKMNSQTKPEENRTQK